MINKILILGLSIILSGCVGVSTFLSTTEDELSFYEYPEVGFFNPEGGFRLESKEDALLHIGEPKEKVYLENGGEEWIYSRNLDWRGLAVWVIIPVPIAIPIGHKDIRLQFSDDGNLTKAYIEQVVEKAFGTMDDYMY